MLRDRRESRATRRLWVVLFLTGLSGTFVLASVNLTPASASRATPPYQSSSASVTFEESGLPTGTSWSVELGGNLITTTNSSIAFEEQSGTYAFQVPSVTSAGRAYVSIPSNGSIQLSDVTQTVVVTFSFGGYGVTFLPLGLPAHSPWTVNLSGSVVTSQGPVSFFEFNGDYSFVISPPAGYSAYPERGTVVVSSEPLVQSVDFVMLLPEQNYTVTFTEHGLPTGTPWSVTLVGTEQSSNETIFFQEPNGTYQFSVAVAAPWTPEPAVGSVDLQGAGWTIDVWFAIGPENLTTDFTIQYALLSACEAPPDYELWMNATATGGQLPYAYAWTLTAIAVGGNPIAVELNGPLVVATLAANSAAVQLTVTDAVGSNSTVVHDFLPVPPPCNPGPAAMMMDSELTDWGLVASALGIGVMAVAVVLVMSRQKKT